MGESRQRVLDAISHRPCDRVPIDFWSTKETDAKLLRHMGFSERGQLLDAFGVDIVYIEGPRYVGPALAEHADGSSDDIWGVSRATCYAGDGQKRQSYKTVVNAPLAGATTVDEVLAYKHWPSADDYDYGCVAEQCRGAGPRAVFFMGDRLNRIAQLKPAMYLRGMEQVLMDSVLEPGIFQAIIDRIAGFYREYLTRLLTAAQGGIDMVVTGDDFGTQHGLILSRGIWREFLGPGFKNFIEISHSFGVPVMHHSCGGIYEMIPDMIEAGLDVLNPLQPETYGMDFGRIKAEFGQQLCFHGGIGIQRNLPFGGPGDVQAEVGRALATLGADSGYIACTAHNIQADVPVENVLALFAAYRAGTG